MTNQPMVSVLMTAYNREKYIEEAIKSVLDSTYKNFELIIVDDGSKDNTVEIAKAYAVKDARIKVYVNEQNLGDYPNRNKAASYATGKYLKYVDADDMIYPRGLEILVEMMEEFPEAGWGLCSMSQFIEKPFPFMLDPKEAFHYNYLGPGLFHRAPLSSIIKREIFEAVEGFKSIRMAGDFEMWHRLAQQYNVVLMPDGIVWYREHDEQEVNHHEKFIGVYEKLKIAYLKDEHSPIEQQIREKLLLQLKFCLSKRLIINLAKVNLKLVRMHFISLKYLFE